MKLMKDMGTQSYIWSGFSTWLAWLGEQQNLMLLSLAIGIVTAIAGLIQRCRCNHGWHWLNGVWR
ncbi:hypothetical protein P2H87_13100 [Mannheimia haemolytica]|nr:hypothetical protein [Mannheimia haemolytica]